MQSLKKIHAWAQMQVPLYTHTRTHAIRCEVTYIWRDYPKHFIKMQSHGCRVAVCGLCLIHGGEACGL